MGISLISPVLPALKPTFGVSDTQVGLVITAYTLPGIFLTPFVGLVADRVGRRRVIFTLLLLFGVAGAGVSFAASFLGLWLAPSPSYVAAVMPGFGVGSAS